MKKKLFFGPCEPKVHAVKKKLKTILPDPYVKWKSNLPNIIPKLPTQTKIQGRPSILLLQETPLGTSLWGF